MSRRTTQAYVSALKYVHENLIELEGQGIIIDFESAMRAALKIVVPHLPIFGCWFHHVQALRRMMTTMKELHELIRTNLDAKTLFRKFQCLALLPANKIKYAFTWLLKEALEVHGFTQFAPFINYYKNQWLNRVKPIHYSVYKRDVRTTGSAEAFNGKVNKIFRTHGNFFQFVECLRDEEVIKADEFCRHVNGKVQPDKRKKFYKKRSELIRNYSLQLESKKINFKLFVNTMANIDNEVLYSDEVISTHETEVELTVDTELIVGDDIAENTQEESNSTQNTAEPTENEPSGGENCFRGVSSRTRNRTRNDTFQVIENTSHSQQTNDTIPNIRTRSKRTATQVTTGSVDTCDDNPNAAKRTRFNNVVAISANSNQLISQNISSRTRKRTENTSIESTSRSLRTRSKRTAVQGSSENNVRKNTSRLPIRNCSVTLNNVNPDETQNVADSNSDGIMTRITRSGSVAKRIRERFDDIERQAVFDVDPNSIECIMECGRRKSTILLPCRHQHTCEQCWFLWKVHQINDYKNDDEDDDNRSKPTCPVCREGVDESISAFN